MKRFLARAFTDLTAINRGSQKRDRSSRRRRVPHFQRYSLIVLLILCCTLPLGLTATLATAQSDTPGVSSQSESPPASSQIDSPPASEPSPSTETLREDSVNERKDRTPPDSNQPSPPPKANESAAPAAGDPYVLEFNRSPVVGTRFSLRGIYDESRLGFTRPRDWQIKSIKALIRYRHSPALYATRSNLTVLINGASIGSIPLNRKEGEIGSAVFDVPLAQLKDYNELTLGALQNNSPTCTQDPYDPSLWTEILPDSKVTFNYTPLPVSLDFSRFPYPIFDELSLYPNQLAYLLPTKVDDTWLTATTRLQAAVGRLADFRRLDTRLVKTLDELGKSTSRTAPAERLVIIGTPAQQPALKSLTLPLSLTDNQILDKDKKALPPNVGVLMLTSTTDKKTPVLIATGNGAEGVARAVQFLVQSKDRKIGTGQSIIVKDLNAVASPPARDWPGYLPLKDTFQLSELKNRNNKSYQDVTVRGSDSPPIEIDFRALPDDQFTSGSSMTLNYSYGPQINAKTSLVEVKLDGVSLFGKRLTSIDGGKRETLNVALPADLIKPTSKIQVDFRLDARERRSCSRVTDQQLWGTLHADTKFDLKRINAVQLPDLKLLQYGFPFAAPQDLSNTAIVLPKEPQSSELSTLLELSARLGRLSKAESVGVAVYTSETFPKEQRDKRQLIGIGTQKNFPFPEAFSSTSGGFQLKDTFDRLFDKSQIQPSPANDGFIKEIISPWNKERVLLALGGQTEKGLAQVQDLLRKDPLFFQVQGDTVLIGANKANPEPDDLNAYTLEFLQREQKRQVDKTPLPNQFFRFLAGSWFMLAPAMVAATLILYGVVQLYLKRIAGQEK